MRFWDFASADAALAAVKDHPDCDGHLDRIVRFDVTVTDEQARRLRDWWDQMERRMLANPRNQLYVWSGWQCASSVARSLRAAGVTFSAPSSPNAVADYFAGNLRHTAGPRASSGADVTVVQQGRRPANEPSILASAGTLIFRFPRLFSAGERTPITIESPDGQLEPVLWSGSRAYDDLIATFHIKPEEAVRLAFHGGHPWGSQGIPNFAVGRWYHIASDHVIGQAAVGGVYVSGDTGEIVKRPDDRIIRFDTFNGDHLVSTR